MFAQLNQRLGITVLFLAFCATCFAGPKTEVMADYDKFADFTKLKTWAWHPAPPAHGYFFAENEHAALKSLIEADLVKRGLTMASGTPDIWVYYDVVKTEMNERVHVGKGLGEDNTQFINRSYAAGTIILDFSTPDPKNNRTLWRGTIQGELKPDLAPDKRRERVSEALTKLLAKYPPK
jgi:hypothetical protein